MMKVTVSALGNIKAFIPEEREVELEGPVSLKELKERVGIPRERNVSFAVNGRVKRSDDLVGDCDEVRFLMVAGAG